MMNAPSLYREAEAHMTSMTSTDRDWEAWGDQNPYFAVLTDPKYWNVKLGGKALEDFFASGERHVDHVYEVIRSTIRQDFQPARVLDYGCGTGRLVVPFAARSQAVAGIDVSPSMLQHARENCTAFGATSARLLHLAEMDSLDVASFDLVHSVLVFQHIPVARGEALLRKLIGLIAEGGVGALQFTFSAPRSVLRRLLTPLRNRIGLLNGLINLMRGRPFSTPLMQMNCYSMNRIFEILIELNCSKVYVEFANEHSPGGAMLYFERPPAERNCRQSAKP
jgi:SAM-dependent methyltransferase